MRIKNIALGGVAPTTLGLAAMIGSGTAFAATPTPATPAATTSTVTTGVEAPETAATGTEAPGTVSDGPGGHQDSAGAVDHQVGGQE